MRTVPHRSHQSDGVFARPSPSVAVEFDDRGVIAVDGPRIRAGLRLLRACTRRGFRGRPALRRGRFGRGLRGTAFAGIGAAEFRQARRRGCGGWREHQACDEQGDDELPLHEISSRRVTSPQFGGAGMCLIAMHRYSANRNRSHRELADLLVEEAAFRTPQAGHAPYCTGRHRLRRALVSESAPRRPRWCRDRASPPVGDRGRRRCGRPRTGTPLPARCPRCSSRCCS